MTRLAAMAALALLLAGCAPLPTGEATPPASTAPADTPTPTAEAVLDGPVQPIGTPNSLVTDLTVPWSIVRLDSGSTFISERGTAIIKELTPGGEVRVMATIPGVSPNGEGGLLGLAVLDDKYLYAYVTAANDNRIVRFPLRGVPGNYSLDTTPGQVILAGIAKANNHDGGRIAFGPDGMLYATVGDAGVPDRAQDPASLNGKILRMGPIGAVPVDNPNPGSYVYSLGHRNPQGIAWDDDDQLWAAEFGQNTWDEFNRIQPGANYGWPLVEGVGNQSGFVDPIAVWPTSEASPSGLLYTRGTFFLAALRGQRIWAIYPNDTGGAQTVAWFVGEYGRIRDVAAGPEGTLWFITNNTSGQSDPRPGDDHLWQVSLDVIREG